jgi:hypothetical protein
VGRALRESVTPVSFWGIDGTVNRAHDTHTFNGLEGLKMKTELKVTTPVGEFTRATSTKYTHVVVWNSPRAMEVFKSGASNPSGVHARWVKDRGYGVTWHGSAESAAKAAAGKYGWDGSRDLVGMFPVA